MTNLSIEEIKKRKEDRIEKEKEQYKTKSENELISLNSNLDNKISETLLSRDDRDSLMPPSVSKNKIFLKECKGLSYDEIGLRGFNQYPI
jgi:hypothetical protein